MNRAPLFLASLLAVAQATSMAAAQVPGGTTQEEEEAQEADAPTGVAPDQAEAEAAAEAEAEAEEVDDSEPVELVSPEEVAEAAGEEPEEPPPLPPPPSLPSTQPTREPGAAPDVGIPLNVRLHGYYRIRYMWSGNVPQPQRRVATPTFQTSKNASYAFQRLRLLPEITYGQDPTNPVAALYMQFDGLDNVVFGDNARFAPAPLFANDPSVTDIDGFDVPDSIRLERAWLQFLIPVGQIRVGRMPSQWGLGLLANDGNGLGEWGDPLYGTTYDRVLFATRPISIVNALTKGDSRPTPLILALAYDKLVENPLTQSTDSPWTGGGPVSWGDFGPYGTQPSQRSSIPFAYLSGNDNDVNQMATALIWVDPEFGPRPTDELRAGFYYVYRWQNRGARIGDALPDDDTRTLPLEPTSRVHILDWYYKIDRSLGPGLPSFYSEGELIWITGRSNTIPVTGGCDNDPSSPAYGTCREGEANVFGGAFRAGVRQNKLWGALLEAGFSSGDENILNTDLTARPLHPDYHVGLITYQIALQAASAIYQGRDLRPLWTRGGVWNSWYLFPQVRAQLIPGIELHAAFLTSFARKLDTFVYRNNRADGSTSCGAFDSSCWIGWEVDLALRVKWGENDLLRWDTEAGIMGVGDALRNESSGLGDDYLWTVQTRMGMVF